MSTVDELKVVDVDVTVSELVRLQVVPRLIVRGAFGNAEAARDHLLVGDVHNAVDVQVSHQ